MNQARFFTLPDDAIGIHSQGSVNHKIKGVSQMLENVFGSREIEFLTDLVLAFVCGGLIGFERELKNKPAGISTQILVVTGAMIFAFMSRVFEEGDPTRIAAQIVSGIGFLGAGIILKSEKENRVTNVTTAASIWLSAGIGMALGFNMPVIALMTSVYAVLISRIPNISKNGE